MEVIDNYKILQELKTQVIQWMESISYDSYTCVLKIKQEETFTTSNLLPVSFTYTDLCIMDMQVFIQKKRLCLQVTGFDNIKTQILNIPQMIFPMEDSEYYEKKSLSNNSLEKIVTNYTIPENTFKQIIEKIFEKIKDLGLIDESIYLQNNIKYMLVFNSSHYEYYHHISYAYFSLCLMEIYKNQRYTSSDSILLTSHYNYLEDIIVLHEEIQKFKQSINLPVNTYKVIFHNKVASALINMIVEALDGQNIWAKNSFLTDKIHKKIFGDNINIIEEPCLENSIFNASIDMEGINIQRKYLVKNGIPKLILLNREYASKFHLEPTGNGWFFDIGYTNIFLEPGLWNMQELIEHMHTGIIIMETIGSGFHINNGEISICIKGFYYENKIFKGSVTGTLSGNIIEIMNDNILGNDLNLDDSLCSPSILIQAMTFAPV
jgi:predicted Zn-dependent protease